MDYERLIKEPEKEDLSEIDADPTWTSHKSTRSRALLYWQLSSLVFAAIAIFAVYTAWRPVMSDDFKKTDFVLARSALSVHSIPFTGGLYKDGNGSLMIRHDPDQPHYVAGNASEVDENWDRLLEGRYVMVEEKDASTLPGYPAPLVMRGKGLVGIDMMHSLHCLNSLRQHLDPALYPENSVREVSKLPEGLHKIHLDHCILQLMQGILCHGDMTPVSLDFVLGRRLLIGNSDRHHTCRTGLGIREWFAEQKRLGNAYP